MQCDCQYRGCRLHFLQLQTMAIGMGIPNHGNTRKIRRDFLNQRQPLGALFGCDQREAGDIAAGEAKLAT